MSIPFLSHSSRAVYGTIVATAVLAGTDTAIASWTSGEFLATVVVTLVVLWFAEIYSNAIGDRGDQGLRERIRTAANEHSAVLEPIVPLGIPLLLGALGVFDEATALLITFVVAIVALGIWGGMAARQRGSTPSRVAGAAVISALIGVVIIILKTWH